MKRRKALLLPAAFVAAAGRSTPAAAAQKLSITVPTNEPDNGAYFIAVQSGYFAAEGLDVELVFAGGGTATPGLLSGTLDGSASSASALSAILRGAALRIVLVFNDTPLGFAPTIGAAFESGALPAVVLSSGRVAAMHSAGQLKNGHLLADYFGRVHMPYNGFVMPEKLLYGDPVLAKKIVRAIVKGARFERAFKSPTLAIVAQYQKIADDRASAADYDDFMRGTTRDFTVGNDLIASDLAVRAGLLQLPTDQIPPIDKIYDFRLVRTVNAELDAARWKPSA